MAESKTTSADATHVGDSIEIAVPLKAEYAATLRVIVASLGSDHGLNVDEIDDLTLAVSEMFTLLADDADDVGATKAHVAYVAEDRTLTISLHRGLADEELQLDPLATAILTSVVDHHVVSASGITLVKHAAGADA